MNELADALARLGLAAASSDLRAERLTGGVSSDIWRVDLPSGPVCVKRALAKLKVQQDWHAPVERSLYEVAWMRIAAAAVPGAAPDVLAFDPDAKLFVMPFLAPETHPLWKTQLRDGTVEATVAGAVGDRLVRIHQATARRSDIAARFPTDAIFHAIRLEPYLEATARRHPDLSARLHAIVTTTAATKLALVHGDVSPKNILIGPDGPIFLDAECAWYGDPAFDLAFCLNHLLLKCLWRPANAARYLLSFEAMRAAYLGGVTWEPPARIEARAAALLPGLFLARVDGKSPVEYITTDVDRDKVRRVAIPLILAPVASLDTIREAWADEISGWS